VNGETPATVAKGPEEAPETRGFISAAIHRSLENVRAGEVGSWPVIIGLIVISAFFYYKSSNFLSGNNLNNIITQMTGTAMIAFGTVFVLLLGEIDLSVGFVSGIGGVVAADFTTSFGHLSGLVAIPLAILGVGVVFGLIQGLFVAKIGVPSFVVTLGGLLVAEGLIVWAVGSNAIYVTDKWVLDLNAYAFTKRAGWIVAIIVSALYALTVLSRRVRRHLAGGETGNLWSTLVKIAAVAVLMFVLVDWSNHGRGNFGLPLAFVLVLVLYVFWDYITMRTTFGRHVYAVGGNAEAARRAGINVPRIKMTVFIISGAMAALGGIFLASRLSGGVGTAGSDPLLMDVIGATVIGGTSLFGGRGRIKSAVLGSLIIAMVANGCSTVGYKSDVRFIATALILLGAVTIDSLARKQQEKAGG
jgi:D-xylose transport system permease protein